MRYHRTTVTRTFEKWVGGKRVITKPAELVDVLVEIDEDIIIQHFARKAANNRSGKSIGLGGLIKAKRL